MKINSRELKGERKIKEDKSKVGFLLLGCRRKKGKRGKLTEDDAVGGFSCRIQIYPTSSSHPSH